MGKPLFKAPDGGYYQIVRVTKDSTRSGPQQGLEISVLVERKVRPGPFPSGLPMSVWAKTYAISGLSLSLHFLGLDPVSGTDIFPP
jgi:hypothetical protein